MKLKICLIAALSTAALPGAVIGATSTTTFQVTTSVSSACSMSASALAFGAYDPTSGVDKTGTSTVNVTCTLLTPYTVKLDGGSTNSSINARKMTDGAGHTITYQLYQDAAHLTVWGDATTGSASAGTGTGVSLPGTTYGNIVAGQNVPAGSYSDTITVTLTF